MIIKGGTAMTEMPLYSSFGIYLAADGHRFDRCHGHRFHCGFCS